MKQLVLFSWLLGLWLAWGIAPLSAQTCDFTWSKIGINDEVGSANAIATDPNDNVIAVGSYGGTVNMDGVNLTAQGGDDILITKYSSGGTLLWAKSFGSTGADNAKGVATDQTGNVYVTGFFNATVNFGPGNNLTSAGSDDIFVLKLDPSGNVVWARRFGGTGSDQGTAVAALPDGGAIFVVGLFENTVTFEASHTSNGRSDFFLLGLSDTGSAAWSVVAGGTEFDNATAVTLDLVGNVYITGEFRESMTLDNDGTPVTFTSEGSADIFVGQFNAAGGFQWMRTAGGTSDDSGLGIACDPADNVYVTGTMQSISVELNNQVIFTQPTDGNVAFVMRFNSEGVFRWVLNAQRTTLVPNDARAITTDPNGDIYVTGSFVEQLKWGNITRNASGSNADLYLVKLDSLKNVLFFKTQGQTDNEFGYGLASDSEGSIYTAGSISDAAGRCSRISGGALPNFFFIKHACFQPVVITPQTTAVSVPGGTDGTATIGIEGGSPEFRYKLGNGVYQDSPLFTDLGVGTYRVYVQGADGCVDSTDFVVVLNATCSAPDPTSGNDTPTNTSFTKSWTGVPSAVAYLVRYKLTNETEWIDTIRVNAPTTEVTVSPVFAESSYDIQIASICPGDTSDWSDLYTIFTESGCFVTNITTTDVTTTTASVSFVNGTGPSTLSLSHAGLSQPQIFTNITDVPFVFTGLLPDTDYEVCIIPFNCPDSLQCTTFKTVNPNASCARVTNFAVGTRTVSSIDVSWTGHANAQGYEVSYRLASSQTYSAPISINHPTAQFTIPGLTPNTNYVIRVRAVCTNGVNSAYDSVQTSTLDCVKPDISATISGSGISVDWADVPGVPQYQVEYKVVGNGSFTVLTPNPTVSNALITGINRNTNYLIRVRSLCSSIVSSAYDSVTITVPGCLPPDVFSELTPDGTQIKWRRVFGAVSYEFQWKRQSAPNWSAVETLTDTVKNFTFLLADTTYLFRVRTVCTPGVELSAYDTLNFNNPGCGTPQNLRVCGNGPALLTWKASPNALAYYVSYRKTDTQVWTYARVTDTLITINNRNNTIPYIARVQSICNGLILSAFSNTDTSDVCPDLCGTPQNVVVDPVTITANQAVVTWNAVTGVRFYEIRYRSVGSTNWLVTTSVTNRATLGGLLNNTQYEVQVRTVCLLDQNSLYSASVSFRTSAASCALPSGLTASNITLNSATVSWTAPPNVTRFDLQYRIVGSITWTTVSDINATSRDLTGLQTGATYEYSVRSRCTGGSVSNYVNPLGTFTVQPVCQPPTTTMVTNIETNRAIVSWTANPQAVSYQVYIRKIGSQSGFFVTVRPPSFTLPLVNLQAGTSYVVAVRTVCGSNNTSGVGDSVRFTTVRLCTAPNTILLQNILSQEATVSFSAVTGAVGYEISYKRTDEANYTTLPVTTQTTVVLPNLRESTDYEVRVRTVCVENTTFSPYLESNFRTTRTGCQAPINLHATAIALDEIVLTWDGSESAQRYEVQFRQRGQTNFITRNRLVANDTIKPVSPAFNYEIRVRAICNNGETTEFTPILTFNTQTANECQPPTTVTVTPSDTFATVSWVVVNQTVGYQVAYRKIGTQDWITQLVTPGTINTLRINGLTQTTDYEVKIQSLCSNEGSLFTLSKNFRTTATPIRVCDAPTNLTATSDQFSAVLRWGRVNRATKYFVYWRRFGETSFIPVETTQDTLFLDDLDPNSVYEFRVRSFCGVGDTSAFSSLRAFSTPALPPCPAPVISSVTAGATTLTVNWNRVSEAIGYVIAFRKVSDPDFQTIRVNAGDSIRKVLTNLSRDTNYEVQVQSLCANNVSDFSASRIVRTLVTDPCATPATSNVVPATDRATFTWTPVTGALGYVVAYRILGAPDWQTRVVNGGNVSSVLITGLTANTTYEWMIQTLCSEEPSEFTAPRTFRTTAGSQTCPTPASVTTTNITRNSVTVNWSAVTGATSYRVSWRANGQNRFTSITVQAPQTTQRLVSLLSNTGYVVRVQAVCANGILSGFREVTFTTLAGRDGELSVEATAFSIYPNPAKDVLYIQAGTTDQGTVILYDLAGKEVFRKEMFWKENEPSELNLNGLSAGLYHLRVQTDAYSKTLKVVIE